MRTRLARSNHLNSEFADRRSLRVSNFPARDFDEVVNHARLDVHCLQARSKVSAAISLSSRGQWTQRQQSVEAWDVLRGDENRTSRYGSRVFFD